MENIPTFEHLDLVACADIDINKAYTRRKNIKFQKFTLCKNLLENPNIDSVIKLTIPQADADVVNQSQKNGKHVYGEKPWPSHERRKRNSAVAKETGLLVGSSQYIFRCGRSNCYSFQSKREKSGPYRRFSVHDWSRSGSIGIQTSSFMKKGGGPMFDMGPYH